MALEAFFHNTETSQFEHGSERINVCGLRPPSRRKVVVSLDEIFCCCTWHVLHTQWM